MAIVIRLDRVMADRKISLAELAERVGITNSNLSKIKNGHAVSVRFSTLDQICRALDCQPGELLEYRDSPLTPPEKTPSERKKTTSSDADWLNYD